MSAFNNLFRLLLVVGGMLFGCGVGAAAEDLGGPRSRIDYDHVELAYADGNPDHKPYANADGYALILNKDLNGAFFLVASYNREKFNVGGALSGREVSDWTSAGPFWRWQCHPRFHLVVGATWQHAALDGKKQDGYALQIGFRSRPLDRVEFNLMFGYLDLVIDDIQTIGGIYLQLIPSLDLGFRVRDYADWDYTSYEGGLRFHF